MNTKKKIAAPVMLVACLIGIGLMIGICIGSVCLGVEALQAEAAEVAVYFSMAVAGAGFVAFFLCGMNTVCCLVWVEDGILHRRGLLWGYRRSCPVSDIQRLESVNKPKGGSWIFIVDSQIGTYEPGSRKGYICLENTEANRRFIATFCGRMIREKK